MLTIVRYLGDKPVKHRFSKQVVLISGAADTGLDSYLVDCYLPFSARYFVLLPSPAVGSPSTTEDAHAVLTWRSWSVTGFHWLTRPFLTCRVSSLVWSNRLPGQKYSETQIPSK
jgi:hypothetical protein